MPKTFVHQCSHTSFAHYEKHRCYREGAVEEDGKWWCRQHSPSAKKTRVDKRDARGKAQDALRDALHRRSNVEALVLHAARLGDPVTAKVRESLLAADAEVQRLVRPENERDGEEG